MKFSHLELTTPYLKHKKDFYQELDPSPLEKPFLISANQDVLELLGVDEDAKEDPDFIPILNGTAKLKASRSFAMCYAGHQFGHFVPRLGDGRAINLGKVHGMNLQLKGSGQTRYSRSGDGRAVLRSSIREYLMSEAMHGLGIATTRAVAIIGSETQVQREGLEKAAIVLRLSPTWVRFGSFEYFNAQGEIAMLQELADYVLEESFPHLVAKEACYLEMFALITKNTAETIAGWQSVGFVHGVMNTDNMSIDGRTIDYGPFAFLDTYNPHYVCNHTDTHGRYSFKSQVGIAVWNLERLALALSPIAHYETALAVLEGVFYDAYEREYHRRMMLRLGLYEEEAGDEELIASLLRSLEHTHIDYNLFFRLLCRYEGNKSSILDHAIYRELLDIWLESYEQRLEKEKRSPAQRHEQMLEINPKYILKNHILQEAIQKSEKGDFSMIEDLLKVALSPCQEHTDLEYLCIPTPEDLKNMKLSCSS